MVRTKYSSPQAISMHKVWSQISGRQFSHSRSFRVNHQHIHIIQNNHHYCVYQWWHLSLSNWFGTHKVSQGSTACWTWHWRSRLPLDYFGAITIHFGDGFYAFIQKSLIDIVLDDLGMPTCPKSGVMHVFLKAPSFPKLGWNSAIIVKLGSSTLMFRIVVIFEANHLSLIWLFLKRSMSQ